ncbi:MAG: hypothetical protein GKR90_02540 [Pseudomonadales bacterium]|nr:hypothetical protein [Pseudomonadales bacterium]
MEEPKLSVWIQLATGIAVLFGLALVIWELNQTRELAIAQRVHDGYSLIIEDARSKLGESFGEVFAKGCVEPSQLTDGEILQLREYFDANLYLIRRMKEIREVGGFDYSWERIARGYVEHWLDSKVGRLHYEKRVRRGLEPEIQQLAEEFLASDLTRPCNDFSAFVAKVRAAE